MEIKPGMVVATPYGIFVYLRDFSGPALFSVSSGTRYYYDGSLLSEIEQGRAKVLYAGPDGSEVNEFLEGR